MISFVLTAWHLGYLYTVALAPATRSGTAAELLANGDRDGATTKVLTCEAGCVADVFHNHRLALEGYLKRRAAVLFLCETPQDQNEAYRRLAAMAPVGFTVRR